ncbi:MAG TPA: hypothetical protein VFK06_03540 [Candidatus Angelobacter sp.]|nr:hypothetical protein [Candidatus Angelobacter sp.]
MELLLTVLALTVALYAVVPRERQLDLQLRVRSLDWLVFWVGFFTIVYLQFFDFIKAHGLAPKSFHWPDGITPQNTIYFAMLVVVGFVAVRIKLAHLTRHNIDKFRELSLELFWNRSYAELFVIIQKHLKDLFRLYDSDFALSRFRARLVPSTTFEEFLLTQATKPKHKGRLNSHWLISFRPLNHILLRILPEYSESQNTTRELVRAVFFSPTFIAALATTRPYLGLTIIKIAPPSFGRVDFADFYLKELLREPQSILYTELQNNQNTISHNRYVISQSNLILHYLLNNVTVAHELRAYKSIGDFMEFHLDELARDRENDPYNQAMMGDYRDSGAWNSPIYAGCRFFDIMVKEALFQGIKWHMWLYYMPL